MGVQMMQPETTKLSPRGRLMFLTFAHIIKTQNFLLRAHVQTKEGNELLAAGQELHTRVFREVNAK